MWFLFNGWDHTILSHSICDAEITLAQQAHLSKHTCVCTHTHITIYRHMLIGTHSHRHTHTYTHIHSYTHTHAHTHTHSLTCTHTQALTRHPDRGTCLPPACSSSRHRELQHTHLKALEAPLMDPQKADSAHRVTASLLSHTEGGHDLSCLYINVRKTARSSSPHLCITATALGRWNRF